MVLFVRWMEDPGGIVTFIVSASGFPLEKKVTGIWNNNPKLDSVIKIANDKEINL
tara:strand:+ start:345 stop:509 length:165 start_codon:yes stop_codon:yes gene_type:complete